MYLKPKQPNLPSYKFLILLILFGLGYTKCYSQNVSFKKLQHLTEQAIAKSYPACVRIFDFDSVKNLQMSAVFSGVVVTKDGYILTAAHVTRPGATYKVIFPDGKACVATGLGKVEYKEDKTIPDVALIKISTKGSWPYAIIGRSSSIKLHEPCLSISYPESLYQPFPVVRFGYVANVRNEKGFIQSTCIMEPGDSGGPLFDCYGRVIGLHSAIGIPEKENYEIPVDLYLKYWTALKNPIIYTSTPENQDSLESDTISNANNELEGIKDFNKSYRKIARKTRGTCLAIISTKNNRRLNVRGTLFVVKGLPSIPDSPNDHNYIVSKSSMVGDNPFILLPGNLKVSEKIIARDRNNDLVLLQPSTPIPHGISLKELTTDTMSLNIGKFLFSPQPDSAVIISISGNKEFVMPKGSSSGYLGLAVRYTGDSVLVTHIFSGPADGRGIREGDLVTAINGRRLKGINDYGHLLQNSWPGDTVTLQFQRLNSHYVKVIVLGAWPDPVVHHPAAFFSGGKSARRDGFQEVYTHDAIIKPYQCGGPVFDIQGHLCGINIARFSRAICLAIPDDVIYHFIISTLINVKPIDK